MWLLTSPILFRQARAKVSAGLAMQVAWQSPHLILYTAPCLSSGLSLPLKSVNSRRKVVIGLCATPML